MRPYHSASWAVPICLLASVIFTVSPRANPLPSEMYLDLEMPGGKIEQIPANCSTWHELYPGYCNPHHQDGWEDNGDGVISACDYVLIGGVWCHIDRVGLNIFVVPGPIGTEQGTWGKIKKFFRGPF